jgi:peptidoglycan/LPS O-acetylase OafA/YrhL
VNPKVHFHVLDSFRGLLALFVAIHHMHYVDSIGEWSFFKYSFWFVEFFFILSGFVLAHSYAYRENLQFKSYFLARTFRIVPLHLVVLVAFLALELFKLGVHLYVMPLTTPPFEANMAPHEWIYSIFLLQAWLPFIHTIGINPPSWSISMEYYLYMILFVTLPFARWIRRVVWFGVMGLGFWGIMISFNIDSVILRGLSSFFLGVLLHELYRKYHSYLSFSLFVATLLEILLLLLVVVVVSSDMAYKALLLNGLFAFVILLFSFERGMISWLLTRTFFLFLGRISYSIYLIHVFVLYSFFWFILLIEKLSGVTFTTTIGGNAYIDFGSPLWNNMMIFTLLIAIVILSKWSYRAIEKRGQDIGKRIIHGTRE